jgi:HEAT repeat protein
LERNGSAEDREIVRPFLKNADSNRDIAIRTIERIGTKNDIMELAQIAQESYGDTKIAAARAALRLSDNSQEMIDTFRQSSDSLLVKMAIQTMEALNTDALKAQLIPLLSSEQHQTRKIAADELGRRLERSELLGVLNAYIDQPSYYYNVVVAFDRALFSRLARLNQEPVGIG